MRAIRFVTASRSGIDEFKERPIFKSLGERYDLYARLYNTIGLSKVYNLYLDGKYDGFKYFGPNPGGHRENDIVVFIHDDVEMLGNNVESELNLWADRGYAVMGLAGGSNVVIGEPALWHMMTPNGRRSGSSVNHYFHHLATGGMIERRDFPYAGRFGALGDVEVLDGLFLAVVLETVEQAGLRFDELFEFHHYDLSFCLMARQAGLKLRTVFIPVIHGSVGLTDMQDPMFVESQKLFIRKYGS
jgi:hypothetical protein